MDTINQRFSKKVKRKYALTLLGLLFVFYFLLINFIEEYFYFQEHRPISFVGKLIVLIGFFLTIIAYVIQLLKKTAISITKDEIIINYYFLGNHVLFKSDIDNVKLTRYKGKGFLVFCLSQECVNKKKGLFSLMKISNQNELLFLCEDLEGDLKLLINNLSEGN